MKEISLKVPDMSCGHCVAAIQGALEKIEGVESVEVTLETQIANVRFINELTPDDLLDAVKAAGYSPELSG